MDFKDISQLITGKGVDLSEEKSLEGVKQIYIEPDNFYSLRDFFKPESLDFIYSKYLINKTKFYRILLKEMLNYCKIRGHIILDFKDNDILSHNQLLDEINISLKDKIEIIENKAGRIILKKLRSVLNKGDSMDNWTFGIITIGERNEWVERQINSIKKQKIPNYEIIICGTYYKRSEKNIKYIQFDDLNGKGWITRKKNLICEKAKYENLVIMHDRIILRDNWYMGMKKYNNYFEVLTFPVDNESGQRTGDWITYGNRFNKIPKIGFLEYRDWDKNAVIVGSLMLFKKSVWEKVKFDETLFWNQGEDIKMSQEFYDNGFAMRVNPFSPCLTLAWRTSFWEGFKYEFNPKELGRTNMTIRYKLRNFIYFFGSKVKLLKLIKKFVEKKVFNKKT